MYIYKIKQENIFYMIVEIFTIVIIIIIIINVATLGL